MRLLNVGFENFVAKDKIISILGLDSAPVKRLVRSLKASSELIDASCGRKAETAIIMESGHVVLSALKAEILNGRIEK